MIIDPYRFGVGDLSSHRWSSLSATLTTANAAQRLGYSGSAPSTFLQGLAGVALTGKRYYELKITTRSSSSYAIGLGVTSADTSTGFNSTGFFGLAVGGSFCGVTPGYWSNGSFSAGGGYTYANGDVIGIAYDATTRKVWFRKNGTWIAGDPVAGTGETETLPSGTYYPGASLYTCGGGAGTMDVDIFVAASEFANAAPSGFSAYAP